MAWMLVFLPILLLGVLAIRWVRVTLGLRDLRVGHDPTPDMTELMRLRDASEIDEAAFVRLRDRFAERASGRRHAAGFEVVLPDDPTAASQRDAGPAPTQRH